VPGELPQLYYRRLDEDRYQLLLARVARLLPSRPVAPVVTTWILGWNSLVFCAIAEMGAQLSARARALNHLALVAVNLMDWSCQTWESTPGLGGDVVPSELIGVDVEGRALFCVAAFGSPGPRSRIPYHVARLDWVKGTVEKVGALEHIFF
jgi:hypothetical protein